MPGLIICAKNIVLSILRKHLASPAPEAMFRVFLKKRFRANST
jgi:hypothetical protein